MNKKKITIDNVEFESIVAAARHYGVNVKSFINRLRKGWTPEEAAGLVPEMLKLKRVTVEGVEFESIVAVARHYGVGCNRLRRRLKIGWTLEEAADIEPREHAMKGTAITVQKVNYPSVSSAARAYGRAIDTVAWRLKAGWPINRAFTAQSHEGRKPPPRRKVEKLGPQRLGNLVFNSPSAMIEYYWVLEPTRIWASLRRGSPPERALAADLRLLRRAGQIDENNLRTDLEKIPKSCWPEVVED